MIPRQTVGRWMKRLFAIAAMAAAGACASMAPDTESPLSFTCVGAEPFWLLEIKGDEARLSQPGADGVDAAGINGEWRDRDFSDGAATWTTGGNDVTIVRELCLSEASERFDYSTDLAPFFPKSPAAPGCCRRN